MASILDYFGGGGFTPTGNTQNLGAGIGGGPGIDPTVLTALGLGIMSGTREDPMGPAMRAYTAASQASATNALRRQMLAKQMQQHQEDLAFRKSQAAQNQANWEKQFGLQQQQAETKPSILTRETETGDTEFYLADPKNTQQPLRKIDPATGQLWIQQGAPTQQIGPQSSLTPGADQNAVATTLGAGGWGVGGIGNQGYGTAAAAPEEESIPTQAQPAQGMVQPGASNLPINRKEFIKHYSGASGTEAGKLAGQKQEKQQSGERVMGLINDLEGMVKNPNFAKGSGPYLGAAGQQPALQDYGIPNLARLWYEKIGGPSEEVKGHMTQVGQLQQAINSELQNTYLKGQGSVTEWERKAINQIQGDIVASRSQAEALAKLQNLRSIIRNITSLPMDSPARNGGVAPSGGGGGGTAPETTQQPSGGEGLTPSERSIQILRSNPKLAPDFDRRYGPGASRRYLQSSNPPPYANPGLNPNET